MTMPPGRGDLGVAFSSLPAGRRTISNLHVFIRETHSKSLSSDMQQAEAAGLGAAGTVHLHSLVYPESPPGTPHE